MRSGSSLREALRTTGSSDRRLEASTADLRRRIENGDPLEAAAEDLSIADPALRMVRAVLIVVSRTGAPAAEPLERVATAARHRADAIAERRSQSAQARASALTMTLLPGGVLAFLASTDEDVRGALTSTVGVSCVMIGGALNITGWLWMRRILSGPRWRRS